MPAVLTLARRVSSFISQSNLSALSNRSAQSTASGVRERFAGGASAQTWAARRSHFAVASIALLGAIAPVSARAINPVMTAHANTFVSGTTAVANPYITVDSTGNIYSVQGTNPIHKGSFNSSGVYTEAALTATPTSVASGIAVDNAGNVFVAENSGTTTTDTHVIEEFALGNATATTVYTATGGPSVGGVVVDASGDIFSTLSDGHLLTLTPLSPGATAYTVAKPNTNPATGLALGSSGPGYIIDTFGVVGKLTAQGNPITDYTASALFMVPGPGTGVAADSLGNVYGSGASNTITERAAGASAAASFRTAGLNVSDVAVDATGNVYFAAGTTISKATNGQVLPTTAVATPSAAVPVSFAIDSNAGMTAFGTLSNTNVVTEGVVGGDFKFASTTCIGMPVAGSTCTVSVTFTPAAPGIRLGAINLTDAGGNIVATAYISGIGTGPQGVIYPGTLTSAASSSAITGVAVDAAGTVFAATAAGAGKLTIAGNTATLTAIGATGSASAIAIDGAGNLYVTTLAGTVYKESLANGAYTQSTLTTAAGPGVAVDGAGNVFVADSTGTQIFEETPASSGGYTQSVALSSISGLGGVAVDAAGNLYVSSATNVYKYTAAGAGQYTQSTVASGLVQASQVSLDGGGNVYIADAGTGGQVVMALSSAGTYTTQVISNTVASGVAVDTAGNVYLGTATAVAKLDVADTQTFTFSNTVVGASSTSQTGTLTNIGNMPLTFPTPTAGNNPSLSPGFTLSNGSTCPQLSTTSAASMLASGTSCTDVISFTPGSTMGASTVNGTLIITDTNLNASPSTTQTILLTGAAIAPPTIAGAFSPMNVDVGNSTALTFTVTNPTGNPVSLTNVGFTATLPSGLNATSANAVAAACTSTFTASGTALSLSGLTLTAGQSCSFTANITPTAGGTGSYTVTTTAVTSDQATGSTASATLTIPVPTITSVNPSTGLTLAPTPVSITGTNFNNVTSVTFGGNAATIVALGSTSTNLNVLTPTASGPGVVDVVVTTADGTATLVGGFTYGISTITVNPATAPNGTYGSAYSQTITASGGATPYTIALKTGSGPLPTGLTLTTTSNTMALISGTPTVPGTYSFTISATDKNGYVGTRDYTVSIAKAPLNVTANDATFVYGSTYPTLTGTIAAPGFVNGDTASSTGLTFATTTATTSTSTPGQYTISATINSAAQADYTLTVTTGTLTITKAKPVLTAPTASTINYGQTLSTSALTGGTATNSGNNAMVPGTFTWDTGSVTPPAGTDTYTVTFTPDSSVAADYTTNTVQVSLSVTKALPTLSPPTASTITYGQMLSASTFSGGSATNPNSGANVSGNFTWDMGTTMPTAGSHTYSVTFTPTGADAANYTTNTTMVTVTVNKATPTIAGTPTASSLIYGASLSTSTLSGGNASTAGNFAWTDGTIIPPAGTDSESVTFTPSDLANYNTTTVNVNVIVSKATPTITTAPTASPITYGAMLSTSSLTGGVASPAGTFAWANGSAIPKAGTASYTVMYTPNDTADYNTVDLSVSLTVSKATPTITALPTASSITYGAMLSASTLTGGSGSTAGSFFWTNGATIPNGGTASYPVTFTPTDSADYNTAPGSVSLTVNQAAQTITFTQPASPINYGDTSAITLSATASSGLTPVFSIISGPGTISGSTLTITGAGTIVVAADQPGNGNYLAATQVKRTIVVNVATQTITFTQPASPVAYGSVTTVNLSASGGGSGNPVTFSVLSGPGKITGNTLTITGAGTIIVAADQAGAANYGTASEVQRSIVVSMAAQTITFAQPASPIVYGSAMTFAVSGTGGASGNPVTFSLISGPGTINGSTVTILTAGSIVVAADQAGNANYSPATEVQRTVVVSKASVTLTGPASQPVLVGTSSAASIPVSITGQYSGSAIAAPSGSITYTILNSSNAAVGSGTLTISNGMVNVPVPSTLASGQYNIAITYIGDTNYAASSILNVTLMVGQFQPVIVWNQPAAIPYGTTLAGVLTAVAQDQSGAAPKTIPGTYVYLNGTTVINSVTVLPAGSYTLTVNFTPTDMATYKTATGSVTLTVNKVAPTVSLQASASSTLAQNPVSFIATISAAFGTPTGTVTFMDGSTSLGMVAVSNGTAVLTTSSLAFGPHTVTAQYSGDSNFTAQAIAGTTVQVNDFTLTSSGTASQTVARGATATYALTFAPAGTTTFASAITLSVSGLPAGATYTITPQSIAAGAGSTNVTLTVMVPAQLAMLRKLEKMAPLTLALLLLPFGGRLRRRAGKLSRLAAVLLLLVGGAASTAALTGCVGTISGPSQVAATPQPETFNIVVTGTSGALSHSTTVTLIVQ